LSAIPPRSVERESLYIQLEQSIQLHQGESGNLAILHIGINHFRQFNILYGYQIGDQLLEELYRRLQLVLREQDYVLRSGNCEFFVVLCDVFNEGHATLAAIKLLTALNESFALPDGEFNVRAAIGIVMFPQHASEVRALLRKAEIALIDARAADPAYVLYAEQPQQTELNTLEIESELGKAIDRDQFELYLQPQVDLKTGRLFGAEALLRWKNGERGFIPPGLFIPVAEQSGQIYEITLWTINAALWLMKDWPETSGPMKVAVNLSTKVLGEPGLVETIVSALKLHGCDFANLTLEVTESALIDDMSSGFNSLEELKSLGINISIDDFGTGHSSMAYFKNIPANELKIDKSFVLSMLEHKKDRHIVNTVINMAQGFDLKVIAEGIENEQTFEALKLAGCDIAQGYYLARPLAQDDFIAWLNHYRGME